MTMGRTSSRSLSFTDPALRFRRAQGQAFTHPIGDAVDQLLKYKVDRRLWLISATLVTAVVWILICVWVLVTVTPVYIVWYGERQDSGLNSAFSSAGVARASVLAYVLRNEGITAVFVTEFTRTQQTGAPVAAHTNVNVIQYPSSNSQNVADQILANHSRGRVLVVGHSTTVDDVAASLGASVISDLSEDQFDRMLVVHRFGTTAHLDRLRYGT